MIYGIELKKGRGANQKLYGSTLKYMFTGFILLCLQQKINKIYICLRLKLFNSFCFGKRKLIEAAYYSV